MPASVNERQIALDLVMEIIEKGAYSNQILNQTLNKYAFLQKEQRSLISRLTEGTIERRLTLDHCIMQYSRTDISKMEPEIRNILRIAVYQIMYMDRIPDSAACDEAVKITAKKGYPRLKGFVNGVLRNIARGKEKLLSDLEKMGRPTSSVSSRSKAYSMPEWIVRSWDDMLGRKACTDVLRAYAGYEDGAGERRTCIRVNTLKTDPKEFADKLKDNGVEALADDEVSYILYISGYDRITDLPGYAEGEFYVQDRSSMQVAIMADPKPKDTIIDVCAAPGGKSLHMAMLMEGRGRIYARDISEKKVGIIKENIARCLPDANGNCIIPQVHDALEPDDTMTQAADIVIADLPCSGLGVLAKKPDIRYRVTEDDVTSLAALQANMLDTVCEYVKEGGKLVFSTCTITAAENHDNLTSFLSRHPDYELIEEDQILPEAGVCDGFYISVLKRK